MNQPETARTCRSCGKTKPIEQYRLVGRKAPARSYRSRSCTVCYKIDHAARQREYQKRLREQGLPLRLDRKSYKDKRKYTERSTIYKLSKKLVVAERQLRHYQERVRKLKTEIKEERREQSLPLNSTPRGV